MNPYSFNWARLLPVVHSNTYTSPRFSTRIIIKTGFLSRGGNIHKTMAFAIHCPIRILTSTPATRDYTTMDLDSHSIPIDQWNKQERVSDNLNCPNHWSLYSHTLTALLSVNDTFILHQLILKQVPAVIYWAISMTSIDVTDNADTRVLS